MHVEIVEPATIGVRTLSSDYQQQVRAWLDHLRNWDEDAYVREHSLKLPTTENSYVLQTNTELRLLFTKEGDRITVYDIATRSGLLAMARAAGGDGR